MRRRFPMPGRTKGHRRKRGVALVIVLASLSLIAVLLAEFQDETSADFGHALAERDALRAEYAARSAINLSRLLIASEPTIRKAVLLLFAGRAPQIPVWEYAEQVLGVFNGDGGTGSFKTLGAFDFDDAKSLGLEGASFELAIVDEDARINFNQAARPNLFAKQRMAQQLMGMMQGIQFESMFDSPDTEGNRSSRQDVCGAVIDWTDSDQQAEACDVSGQQINAGSEDSFYQLLDSPYERKNAGFDSLEELHLVRGVGDDFWATFVDPDPGDPQARVATVWGRSQINVNTANPQTLWSLICAAALPEQPFCTDPDQIQRFFMLASILRGATAGVPLFTSPNSLINALKGQGMVGTVMKSFELQAPRLISEAEFKKTISTDSKVFSIVATGVARAGKRETRRRVIAVVDFQNAPGALDFSKLAGADLSGATGSAWQQALDRVNPATLPEGASADTITAAFRPSPAGRVIYYRVE